MFSHVSFILGASIWVAWGCIHLGAPEKYAPPKPGSMHNQKTSLQAGCTHPSGIALYYWFIELDYSYIDCETKANEGASRISHTRRSCPLNEVAGSMFSQVFVCPHLVGGFAQSHAGTPPPYADPPPPRRQTPPPPRRQTDTVNRRAVRILLECILVLT